MKFALMKNLCPACGAALLGESEERRIKDLVSKLRQQSFSKDMNDVSRYDCALFVFNEIQRELSTATRSLPNENDEYKTIEIAEDVDPENMKQLEQSDFEFDKEALKKEYLKTLESSRNVYHENDDLEDFTDDEDDYSNMDERAARLKKTYKRHRKMIQKNMDGAFRRISDE